MFIKNHLCYLLILFRLFKMDYPKYHKDYFDELEKYIRQNLSYDSFEEALLHISCNYLYLSKKRFDFCQDFIRYCNKFFVKY